MAECPSCGRENADDARFCSACGASIVTQEPARESRKVVTILFCDLVGSTALGESTDPEALRTRMRRYFDDLRTIIERHGGTVEKFVGDAVMAVFGIPVSHEDDALRAVRTAAEMRAAVVGHGLEARIGVNTGEVVVGGEGETLVTGDAVNVAARLEQAAAAGEVLIGGETQALVRDAVLVEPVEPLTLKGKSEPVAAYRLLEVLADAEGLARNPEAPLVGRTRERERLRRDFEDAVAEGTCRLFTLLGPAGIGKSRLVADFLDHAATEADVLRGRCLHYGEGITYWPLVEVLVRLGVEPEVILGSSPQETQLAFRRLLESRASERPQIVVLDDIQWAEPTFLDLVEHVADFSRDAPIFLLCVARTELLDLRPGWGGGKMNASSILLEPLSGDDCEALIENLLGDAELDERTRDRITGASEGNPLFVEEMLAMVREGGGNGEVVVPPTIHALLQARLDQLGLDERVVIERGSVEGEVFHRGSVAQLSPDSSRPDLEAHLSALVRKELIRPNSSTFVGDDAFRFRHLLIRDAAYESLPKSTRAELHERFADWLADHELVEQDEILGYHLEQAHLYRKELNSDDPRLPDLSSRTARHLADGGRGALDRGDVHAGLSLLRRAAAVLPPDDERRHRLALDQFWALWEVGDQEDAQALIRAALTAADPFVRTIAEIVDIDADFIRVGASADRTLRLDEARAVLEAVGHDEGLFHYWLSIAREAWFGCRAAECATASERAVAHAERAGMVRGVRESKSQICACYIFSPIPVSEAVERVDQIRRDADASGLLEAWSSACLGRLLAMRSNGDVERARELVRRGRQAHRDAGARLTWAAMAMAEAHVEWRAGRLDAMELVLRAGVDALERLRDRGFCPTVTLYLADCLLAQGRLDEVEALCVRARELTSADDVVNFVFLDGVEGVLLGHSGRPEEGCELAKRAVELAETTDFFELHAWSRMWLAESLAIAGRNAEAAENAARALAIHEAKGDLTGGARARERLDKLGIPTG